MEIMSFVLGIISVVLLFLLVDTVYVFVRMKKADKTLTNAISKMGQHWHSIDSNVSNQRNDLERSIESVERDLNRRIDDTIREFSSQLDSRLDKLENKFLTKK